VLFVGGDRGRTSLLDSSGKAIYFNPPLNVRYKHSGSTSNSGTNFNGANMLLTYDGIGMLNGIPQMCVDPTTNRPSDCIPNGATDSSLNLFDITINPEVPLTDLVGNKYYALPALATEHFPMAADQSICDILDFSNLPSVPDYTSLYKDPSNKGQTIPTDLSGYLQGGKAVVIKGVTQWEAKSSRLA